MAEPNQNPDPGPDSYEPPAAEELQSEKSTAETPTGLNGGTPSDQGF